jgi:hypothetical protein
MKASCILYVFGLFSSNFSSSFLAFNFLFFILDCCLIGDEIISFNGLGGSGL